MNKLYLKIHALNVPTDTCGTMSSIKSLALIIALTCSACWSPVAQVEEEDVEASAFVAGCSGTVLCPIFGPCADWTYSVTDDDSGASTARSTFTPVWGDTCSGTGVVGTEPDAWGNSGLITYSCETYFVSMKLNRASSIVYIHAQSNLGGAGFDWTPHCQ